MICLVFGMDHESEILFHICLGRVLDNNVYSIEHAKFANKKGKSHAAIWKCRESTKKWY